VDGRQLGFTGKVSRMFGLSHALAEGFAASDSSRTSFHYPIYICTYVQWYAFSLHEDIRGADWGVTV
jgi:hypothetical protein